MGRHTARGMRAGEPAWARRAMAALLLAVCAAPATAQAPVVDAGVVDAGVVDAGAADAGVGVRDTGADAGIAPREFAVPENPGRSQVVVVPIHGTIELGLTALVDRALREYPQAAAIVLDVNTFGGRVDAAVQIRDALIESDVPTVGYVHPRAISAGALITLACERVAFAPAGSMGAATPFSGGGSSGEVKVDEKMISYMRAEMRTTASHRGRPGEIAEAMVDPDVEVDGVIPKGKTLTLDTDAAMRLGMADMRASDLSAVIAALEIEDAQVVHLEETWGEQIARALTDPTVSGMLMSVGMLALLASMYTGNFGILTLLGLLALGLFFGGHAAVHLVGWEEALLLLGGLGLLGVELVAIPGFGLIGVLGLCLIGASFVLSLLAHPLEVAIELGVLGEAVQRVAVSFLGTVLGAVVMIRYLPHSPLGRRLVLSAAAPAATAVVDGPAGGRATPPGTRGTAEGDLRPTGRVRIEGALHDARSERAFIARGATVEVVGTSMGALVVRAVAVSASDGEAAP